MFDPSAYRYVSANRVFVLLWAGQAISALGDSLYDVAIVWYLLDTTGSALVAGGIAAATIAGRAVGSMVAASLIDRVGARRIMLGSDLGRLLLTLGVAVQWLVGYPPSPPELYALALMVTIGGGWFDPARASAIPDVVTREHLLHANALEGASGGVVAALGWALGGIVVAAIGPGPALLVDAGTFLGSYLLVRAAHWDASVWTPDSRSGLVTRIATTSARPAVTLSRER